MQKMLRKLLMFVLVVFVLSVPAFAGNVYKGINYSSVYNFSYYVKHNSYVKKHYSKSPAKALKYFVKKGMKKGQRASKKFSVVSYIYGNRDLRRIYKNDLKKYYLHYIQYGRKEESRKKTATGIKSMQNYCTRYAGIDYAPVYDYNYYVKKYPDVKKKYGYDDVAVFEYFVEHGIAQGHIGCASFNVKEYYKKQKALHSVFGTDYEDYVQYYLGAKDMVPLSEDEDFAPINEADYQTKPTVSSLRNTVNGTRTLKAYLTNALVPCGRTLYIWGGGWDDSDASVIGYQEKWNTFFKNHATSDYDYGNYRYSYGNGLDCSGFAAWTLYNTLYTKSGGAWLVYQSSTVAETYYKKGWVSLAKNSSDSVFRPGDVVSMDGHVWISLGQCVDGSVLVIHSSPKGVQISGTSGRAAELATYYMKKYFPDWPYPARTVGSSYLKYLGKARWNVTGTGHILSDPDGIQKMSGESVLKLLLGN